MAGETVIVTFSYDNRRRLIGEARVVNSTTVYDILYTYDQLGNRLSKIDYGADPDRKTLYYYDSDPNNRDPNYVTNNNRLLWYEDYVDDGQSGWDLIRTVNYTYYQVGHVSNITIKDEYPDVGDPNDYEWYRDLAFYYNSNHELWRVLWDRWKVDGQGEHTNYEKLAAREFYYDSPRQRHMWRNVDPNEWLPLQDPNEPTHAEHWTDYMGEMPYGDFDMLLTDNDPNYDMQVDEQTRYLTAAGLNAQQTVVDPNTITYFHGDLINSTMLATDPNGDAASSLAYTAFGETIGDPIGIMGGLNLYLYCGNNPLATIDPLGMFNLFEHLPVGVAEAFITYTGGDNSWLDDEDTVNRISAGAAGFAAGIIVCIIPGACPFVGFGAGVASVVGTGNPEADAALTGVSLGAGFKGVAEALRKGLRGFVHGLRPKNKPWDPPPGWDPPSGWPPSRLR